MKPNAMCSVKTAVIGLRAVQIDARLFSPWLSPANGLFRHRGLLVGFICCDSIVHSHFAEKSGAPNSGVTSPLRGTRLRVAGEGQGAGDAKRASLWFPGQYQNRRNAKFKTRQGAFPYQSLQRRIDYGSVVQIFDR